MYGIVSISAFRYICTELSLFGYGIRYDCTETNVSVSVFRIHLYIDLVNEFHVLFTGLSRFILKSKSKCITVVDTCI